MVFTRCTFITVLFVIFILKRIIKILSRTVGSKDTLQIKPYFWTGNVPVFLKWCKIYPDFLLTVMLCSMLIINISVCLFFFFLSYDFIYPFKSFFFPAISMLMIRRKVIKTFSNPSHNERWLHRKTNSRSWWYLGEIKQNSINILNKIYLIIYLHMII